MAPHKKKSLKESTEDNLIRDIKTELEEQESLPGRSRLELTRSELDDVILLCSYLGLSRDACLSSATKYCCAMMAKTTTPLKPPKLRKQTKSNPFEIIDYLLSAEATSVFRKKQSSFSDGWPKEESLFVRMAVAVLGKKLLPPKSKRKAPNE